MKKSSYLLICQVSVVLALGCDSIVLKKLEQQNPSEGADHQLPDEALPSEDISYAALKLDFSDAIALLVSESSSSVALASNSISGSNLKKVTPDGTIEDIVITGKAEIENFMIGPSKRFYGLLKNRSAWGAHESCLLFTVSLDRGEPTCIDNSLTSISWSPDNAVLANPAIQFDSSGAVYYSGLDESGQRVLRMFDGEQTRDLLKGRFELNDFIVLRDGTVYLLGSTLDTGTQWFRMLAPDGSLSDLTMPERALQFVI